MAPARKLPRPFAMHWGSGEIVEEATYSGEWHEPCIQLMRYTEGEAAGSLTLRFCTYTHEGRFQRSPLMLSEVDIDGLRDAIKQSPQVHALLKRLID